MIIEIEALFKIMADKNRLRILMLLNRRPMCVCELAYVLGVTQPSISRHLKRMKEAGFIDAQQDGLWTNYFLKRQNPDQKRVLACLQALLKEDAIIKEDLDRVKGADRTRLCGS